MEAPRSDRGEPVSSSAPAGFETRSVLRCLACGSPWAGLAVPGECPSCGKPIARASGVPILVREYEQLGAEIERATESHELWYTENQSIQWTGPYRHHLRKRIAYVEDAIERFAACRPAERLGLDLGCGDGEHDSWLSRHVGALHASDYNIVRLRRAAATGNAHAVFLADVTDYPAANSAYDVVFFNHVLEHIPDDLCALREVRRILAPDGIAILGVPNEGAAFWRLAYRLQPETRASTDHVHFYTAETIAARCREAGFAVREVHPIGWGLPHWRYDARVRGRKWVDDAFETVGRRFLPGQATSLYLVLSSAAG